MKIDSFSQKYYRPTYTSQIHTLKSLNKEYIKLNGHSLQDDFWCIINDSDNLLGEGQEKLVFSITNISDYVIALFKSKFNPKAGIAEIKSVKDLLSKFNFGQCIADNNNGIQILRRVNGEPNLLPNWFSRVHSFAQNGDITREDALLVLEKLRQLENFPQDSFDLLVQKINYLNKKNIRIDTINPNNVLVESNSKEINLVDIDFNFHNSNIKPPFNGYNDVAYLLLDMMLHNVYLEKLPVAKKIEFIKVTKNLIRKLKNSADRLGLSSSLSTSRQVYTEIQNGLSSRGEQVKALDLFEQFNQQYFSDLK